jgi:hypothetical protein
MLKNKRAKKTYPFFIFKVKFGYLVTKGLKVERDFNIIEDIENNENTKLFKPISN